MLGQRVIKTTGSNKTYFNYDESGKLIGEYDNNGNGVREYIYLENMPIALISNERNGKILQIHTDHLQTPKVITDKNGTVLWQWETEAFGSSKPKIESIKMPLRMAGQYADDEVGLFYNYYRFYDPNMGRYVENDPIGLEGGLNVYGYVGGNPLHKIDPTGENPGVVGRSAAVMVLMQLCRRNPKICKEAMQCISNPAKCKNKFCKNKPNRIYHGDNRNGVCEVPGCKATDSDATRAIKANAAKACMIMRKFVAYACFNGNMDSEHMKQYRDARAKYKNCLNCGGKL